MDLEKIRLNKGLTREVLATKTGMHRMQIYNYEKGKAPVPMKYAGKLALALGISKSLLISSIIDAKIAKMQKAVK